MTLAGSFWYNMHRQTKTIKTAIMNALKSYVENAEWHNNLHKRFVKRDENGKEIELDKAPDWYETEIQKSIGKSATEKDWSKKEDAA